MVGRRTWQENGRCLDDLSGFSPSYWRPAFPPPAFSEPNERTLAQAAQEADVIVHATVVGQEAAWRTDQWGRHIYTTYAFNRCETVKGVVEGYSLTVRVMGGTVDDVTEEVTPGWRFAVGQEFVLFLNRDDEGVPHLRRATAVVNQAVTVGDHVVPVRTYLDAIEETLRTPSIDPMTLLIGSQARDTSGVPGDRGPAARCRPTGQPISRPDWPPGRRVQMFASGVPLPLPSASRARPRRPQPSPTPGGVIRLTATAICIARSGASTGTPTWWAQTL